MKHKAPLILLLLIASTLVTPALAKTPARYTYQMSYTIANRGDETITLPEEDATIYLFRSDRWQTVMVVNSSPTIRDGGTDEDGNKIGIVDFPLDIPSGGQASFTVTFSIENTEKPKPSIDSKEAGGVSDIPSSLVEEYGLPTETFTSEYEEVRALAEALVWDEETVLGVVLRLLDWVLANTTYRNFEVPQYPAETLAEGLGDCDDQAILLISMLRSLGVPAFLQVGIVFHTSIENNETSWDGHLSIDQKGVGWHGWAMVYIPPWGWLPIDLTLVQADTSLELVQMAPEYGSSIVSCFNVSRQEYIGDTRRARERIISSDIYISVKDVVISPEKNDGWLNLTVIALGATTGGAIVLMFLVSGREKGGFKGTGSR